VSATAALTGALQKLVLRLEADLRTRVEGDTDVLQRWKAEHDEAIRRGRTAGTWLEWRNDRVTQAAVAWVLTTVFVRFCEDNGLVGPVWISGPGQRRQEALDARDAFFREHPEDTDREWLERAFAHLRRLRATAALVDEHSALRLVSPSGPAASEILGFWWQRDENGGPLHDLSDPTLSTRFLGDLYQDLSEYAKATYALLQTPIFVEEFILDRTLEPALADRPLEGFQMIDPACGSGHFLLGAFARLLERWNRQAPGLEVQARVQTALDAIHGVDINPFAVAIARFRLTVAAMQACGLRSLEQAPAFRFHIAVGDSLLHGVEQLALALEGAHDRSEVALSGYVYSTEDLVALRSTLAPGRYDVVVGNPPYITVKDKALNEAYRQRYRTCSGKYAMTVPFMERFFNLARPDGGDQPAGWVGQITSNSFMKREFGAKLIEQFLAKRDLRLVADTSGAYIPGHGTPTVIIVGRNQPPVLPDVRAVLGVRGEPGRPDDPARGIVWTSIVEHVDEPGWDDGWVTVADVPFRTMAKHPWSLTGGGALSLKTTIEENSALTLESPSASIGITSFTLEDDVYVAAASAFSTRNVPAEELREMVLGDGLRDWCSSGHPMAIFPYDSAYKPLDIATHSATNRWMWPFRTNLANSLMFGRETKVASGLLWAEYGRLTASKLKTPLSIAFAFVATHNHFLLDRGGKVFNRSAPVIKLPAGASEDDHLGLLGVLNSSIACFWLKQNSHNKGSTVDASGARTTLASWENFYEFTGTTLQDYPLPATLPTERGRLIDVLAQDSLRLNPDAVAARMVPTRQALADAHSAQDEVRAKMIAAQEELDWAVYRLYGLVDSDLTYSGLDLPGLSLGERAFEIALFRAVGAGEETAWFERHSSTPITEIPAHWPAAYRELVQRRLDLIASDPKIHLLEQPEYKRRWASESWESREEAALRDWLLDRLEDRRFWFDPQGRPLPRSIAQLADVVAHDPDLVSVLALWEGRPDVQVTRSLTRLLEDEAIPFLAAYRCRDSGLDKRAAWEETWALQRREDAGERVGPIPIPPKYTSADFRKVAYWHHRGKLDVPKERFILYPDAGRETDPTPLLGWAGWDHAEQALALATIIQGREAEGWPDERLIPLVAGLSELQPWVEQWHSDVDPKYGVSLAAFCREQLTNRARQVGLSIEGLRGWRVQSSPRGAHSRR
jgi:hypothetical protein